MAVERMSLLLELEAFRDVSSLHSQVGKDKEAMVEGYQKSLEKIFAYVYGCCVFKHSICGDLPEILDGMPDYANSFPLEFFVNPRYPPGPNSRQSQGCKGRSGHSGEGSEGGCHCRGARLTSFSMLVFVIFGDFYKGRHFATHMRIISCNPWFFLAHFNGIIRYHQDMSHV